MIMEWSNCLNRCYAAVCCLFPCLSCAPLVCVCPLCCLYSSPSAALLEAVDKLKQTVNAITNSFADALKQFRAAADADMPVM